MVEALISHLTMQRLLLPATNKLKALRHQARHRELSGGVMQERQQQQRQQ